jgi:AcrR family transcriptional regulator
MAETAAVASSDTAPIDLDRAAEAAMTLADQRGWNAVSLIDIARASGTSLAELYRHGRSKRRLLVRFARQVDAQVLDQIDPEDLQEPAKDRLFELLMERFDLLKPHRAGLKSILDCYRRDPAQALGGLNEARRSMRNYLEAADLSTAGLRGELRLQGLIAIYLYTLRTFLEDDSEDLSRTMATLDTALRRIERPAQVLDGRERPGELLRERVRDGLAKRGLGPGATGAEPHEGPILDAEAEEIFEPGPAADPRPS